jgi:hypothetical protein
VRVYVDRIARGWEDADQVARERQARYADFEVESEIFGGGFADATWGPTASND